MTIFADHAISIARTGACVIPIGEGRKPCIGGWHKWSRPPSLKTVARWSEQFPSANVALVPGRSGVTVIDVDDVADLDAAEKIFGPTPVRVRSRRGAHLYYARTLERLPGDLRRWDLEIDVKAGNALVIAPPSLHETGLTYSFDAGGWDAIRDVPELDVVGLHRFIDRKERKKPRGQLLEMRSGSRRQWLNDELCRHAASCDDFNTLLDLANMMNKSLADRGIEPLLDNVVLERAEQVWRDVQSGAIQMWHRRGGVARVSDDELNALLKLDSKTGADALALLAKLRVEHAARCRRGETFPITPRAMEKAEVMSGWSWKRYARARDLLVLAGMVVVVSPFANGRDGRRAAQYSLAATSDAGRAPISL